jgi:hypothetical protein
MSEVEAIHRAICAESCAYRGEPPCYTLNGAWPNPDCDEPGCEALAKAAASAMPAAPPAPADVASALRRLGDECWSLVCKDYPIADTGDADVGYEVVSHHQAKPTERREGFGRTPIEALQDAGLLIAAPPAPADVAGLLEALASDCENTDGWEDAASTCYAAAAALTAQAGEIERTKRERNEHCAARNMLVADDEWRGVELAAAKARIAELTEALPSEGAVAALANYRQADADGVMVLVSRQAIEECLPLLRAALAKGSEP